MKGLPILTYHAIDTSESVIATSPKRFAATMATLQSEGFRCVDLEDWLDQGRPEVERAFALTFDDGLSSIQHACEAMAKFGMVATAFLVTGRMGSDNRWRDQSRSVPTSSLLDWSDLDDLSAAGFRFGAHTVNHPDLNLCSEVEVEFELIVSRRAIEEQVRRACRFFAYPYGKVSARVRKSVSRHFDAGFTTRLDASSRREDASALSRIDAYYLRTDHVLKRMIDGNWSGWLAARRAARAIRGAFHLA